MLLLIAPRHWFFRDLTEKKHGGGSLGLTWNVCVLLAFSHSSLCSRFSVAFYCFRPNPLVIATTAPIATGRAFAVVVPLLLPLLLPLPIAIAIDIAI